MSGTSVNAIDAVLADFSAAMPQVIAIHEEPIGAAQRARLLGLTRPGENELDRAARLDSALARLFAQAVNNLLKKANISAAQIQAIGSHGQTIRHEPDASEPYTVQIGNPSLLAELSQITTVADFRRRDMAAGGQGAPLAPAFHAAFFTRQAEPQAIVNIGGIANITVLPAAADSQNSILGFDTGPGNALLDAWAERHLGLPFDRDARWALQGQILEPLLTHCLNDAYFHRPPPKSTGREYFHLDWLEQQRVYCALQEAAPGDVQATLAALSARAIADAVSRFAADTSCVLVCGGGVHNPAIMRALQQQLAPLSVASTASRAIDPDYLEALGFAWLAKRTLARESGNLPSVTGAAGRRILGGIYFA